MFNTKTDKTNKDLLKGETRLDAKSRFLDLWGDFEGLMEPSPVEDYGSDKLILRADLCESGLKALGAEKLIAESEADTLVYVAPRVGHAADAIAFLSKLYGKRCVFFCPSSKTPSKHQAALLAYGNTELKFVRIAAMPVLNGYARKWAEENDAEFIPFGLTGVSDVTAGLVKTAERASLEIGEDPTAVFCAVSTGTMIRALQIGWPDAEFYGVAVARNMKNGEVGEASVVSHHLPFLKEVPSRDLPPFPTTKNYDAKAFELFEELNIPGSIFINVGSDDHIERNLSKVDVSSINSYRDWKDFSDLI